MSGVFFTIKNPPFGFILKGIKFFSNVPEVKKQEKKKKNPAF